MRDMLEARKRGDYAFRDKDFKAAIDCYSQVYFVEVFIDFHFGCNIMSWKYGHDIMCKLPIISWEIGGRS